MRKPVQVLALTYLVSLSVSECIPQTERPSEVSGQQQVLLQITETAGVDRKNWPVTSGIPFPKDAISDERQVALLDSSGNEVPLQTTVLTRWWDDQSIRWLLLDFQANVRARGTARYGVVYGKSVTRARIPSTLSLTQEAGLIRVNTGVLRFVVSRNLLSDVEVKTSQGWQRVISASSDLSLSVGPPPHPEYLSIVTGEGRNRGEYHGRLDPHMKVVVEDAGPLRVQVKVEGWLMREDGRRFGPFTVRINAFAGHPHLQVYHTFANSDLPERGLIEKVGMHLPLALTGTPTVTFGSLPVTTANINEARAPYYLLQSDWNRYEVVKGQTREQHEGQSQMWLDVSGQKAGVMVHSRDGAKLFPKELKVQDNMLSVWTYPEDGDGPLDLRRAEQKESPEWREFREKYPKVYGTWLEPVEGVQWSERPAWRYKKALAEADLYYLANHSALGFSRTHEVCFFFHPGEISEKTLVHFAEASNEPLQAFALQGWYDYTNTLGRFGWQDTVNFPLVENYFAKKIDWAVRHQNEWFPSLFWGIVNYGGLQTRFGDTTSQIIDQWLRFAGRMGWTNTEVDAPNHLLLYYLRTGDTKTLRFLGSVVRQMMDVVTAHANLPDFEPVTTVPNWKKGGMNRHEYEPYGGGVLENHTWNEGLINYYYLTGYRRAYDVAMEMGDFALRLYGQANRIKQWRLYEHQFDRNASNNWRLLLKHYELTGDERCKEESEKWREFYLRHSPKSFDSSTFMTVRYLLPTYVLDYRLFGDERVAEEIMNITRWLKGLLEKGEVDMYVSTSFLAPAACFDITRGGGPLEDLLKWWRRKLIAIYQRQEAECTSMRDFDMMRWDEFGPLFYFLRACRDANITEKTPTD